MLLESNLIGIANSKGSLPTSCPTILGKDLSLPSTSTTMGNKNELYRQRYPSLRGASMFISSKKPDSDEAVFINLNEPSKDIPDLVKQGYLVRTRSDAETIHARVATTAQRDQALSSGAQYVSTDYPLPNEYFSNYSVLFPEGTMIRCNPLNAPENCRIQDTDYRNNRGN